MSELEQKRMTPLLVWVVAAMAAVAVHAGCAALGLEYLRADDAEEATGALAIEIGVEWTSPKVDPSDLPPGPDADESAASPAVMEQQTVVEQTDLPKATPVETDDPDRLVTPNDAKKPKDEDPKIRTVQSVPSVESVPTEATATPNSEAAPEAPRSVAPAAGPGESTQRVRLTWQK